MENWALWRNRRIGSTSTTDSGDRDREGSRPNHGDAQHSWSIQDVVTEDSPNNKAAQGQGYAESDVQFIQANLAGLQGFFRFATIF